MGNWTSSRKLSQQKALWHIRHWTKKKIIITIIIIIRSTLRLSVKAASTKWTRLLMEPSMLYLANKEVSPVLHCDKTRRAFEITNEPQASVFYISRVFSNVRSVLWQFNTRLRLLQLLYDVEVMGRTINHAFFYGLDSDKPCVFLPIRARAGSYLYYNCWFSISRCWN